jgi:pSer/pThr/pTyr-binding forkhead associated (FHA) protein
VPLVTATALIGRRSASRAIAPEIDLGDLAGDPAVSHRHAQLARLDDGRWTLCDLGSSNGTTLNGIEVTSVASDLNNDDVIEIGAWSTLTVRVR